MQAKHLLETIRKVRMTKIIQGLETVNGPLNTEVGNLSAMECNTIRTLFLGSLDRFFSLQKVSCQAVTMYTTHD